MGGANDQIVRPSASVIVVQPPSVEVDTSVRALRAFSAAATDGKPMVDVVEVDIVEVNDAVTSLPAFGAQEVVTKIVNRVINQYLRCIFIHLSDRSSIIDKQAS